MKIKTNDIWLNAIANAVLKFIIFYPYFTSIVFIALFTTFVTILIGHLFPPPCGCIYVVIASIVALLSSSATAFIVNATTFGTNLFAEDINIGRRPYNYVTRYQYNWMKDENEI